MDPAVSKEIADPARCGAVSFFFDDNRAPINGIVHARHKSRTA
jgi:hypothetical protein